MNIQSNSRLRRLGLSLLVLAVSTTGLWAASQGRLSGSVKDQEGNPIKDATVTVTGVDRNTEDTYTTNKKGKFSAIVVDAGLSYKLTIEAEGFVTLEQPLSLGIGTNREEYVLVKGGGGSGAGGVSAGGDGPTPEVAEIYNAGVSAFGAGDFSTARMKFEEALVLDASLTSGHIPLAAIYIEAGEYDKAAASADIGLTLNPTEKGLLNIAYESHKELGNTERSAELLELIKAQGGGADAAIAIFNEGAEAAQAGDLNTAIARFEEALVLNPELINAHAGLARIYLAQRRFAEAAASSEIWLSKQPGVIHALQVRYDAYRLLGDEENTQKAFDDFAAASPLMLAKSLHDTANNYFNANQISEAKALAEKILELQPEHARGNYILGLCLANQGDSAGAKKHLEKFVSLAPNDPDARVAAEMAKSL